MAILIAVLIVALVTAGNDYSKELQFRALEKSSGEGDRAMVLRDGGSQLVRGRDGRRGRDIASAWVYGRDPRTMTPVYRCFLEDCTFGPIRAVRGGYGVPFRVWGL